MAKTTFDVRPHRDYPDTHTTVIATTANGRSYACTWAGTPTDDDIRDAWRNDRRAFTPYNAASGDH